MTPDQIAEKVYTEWDGFVYPDEKLPLKKAIAAAIQAEREHVKNERELGRRALYRLLEERNAEREEARRVIASLSTTVGGLIDQQAMPDDFFVTVLRAAAAYLERFEQKEKANG